MHYQQLTRLVIGTDLTTLGRRGKTPSQTMKTKLIEMSDVFEGGGGNGYYWLKDAEATSESPAVRNVNTPSRSVPEIGGINGCEPMARISLS